jgi:hypothetical protein
MKRPLRHAVGLVAAALAAPGALAESAASTASSATSSAAGSVSNSLQGSSNSSSRTTTAADGEYRVDDVTVAADRPGMVRLALQPLAPGGDRQPFMLVLPQRTVDQQGLVRGDTVSARARPYGIEFAHTQTRQAFFLVLADAVHRELDARPVMPTAL